MIELSIIMVSYNTKELTLSSLRSIFEQTKDILFEVIVLDNASIDGSADAISREFPQIKLISSKENYGFAKGNNIAIKEAKGEYLLLLNPDTIVLNKAIQHLMAFAKKNQEARIWGGKTQFSDGSLNPASCWRKMTMWNIFCRSFGLAWLFPSSPLFNSEAYGGWPRDTVREVDIVSGCFFMIKREFWESLNGFSPQFFMYGEEADLCLRAKNFGAKPMVTPDATIVHYGGASEKVYADKMVKLLKAKHLLLKKHWPFWKYKIGMIIYPLYPLNRTIVLRILGLFSKRFNKEVYVWQEIWQRRNEWSI